MTIVEFLNARLDERRKRYNSTDELYMHEVDSVRGPGWFEGECTFPACQWMTSGHEKVVEEAYYEHLDYAHDRAWVWADLESKRAVIALHSGGDWHPYRCPVCLAEQDHDDDGVWYPVFEHQPCPTVRLLASPYADHPDYDEKWKP